MPYKVIPRYGLGAAYLRCRLTFTAIIFGKTDSSIPRFLQHEKRPRDERLLLLLQSITKE